MSVYRHPDSPYYWYDFQVRGSRFFGSTKKTSKREAKEVEAEERQRAKLLVAAGQSGGPMTLDQACGRYWEEVGRHHAAPKTTEKNLARLLAYFGKDKLIAEITSDDAAKLVAWRRGQSVQRQRKHKPKKPIVDPLVQPATVNRSVLDPLKRVLNRAKIVWGVKLPHKIEWKKVSLEEPEERVRELYAEEAVRLEQETKADYVPIFEFMEASGLRLNECLIEWRHVSWSTGIIERKGKGKKTVRVVMNARIRGILLPLRGQHPSAVFTYVCEKDQPRLKLKKGVRYPITYNGLKTYHRRRRKRAKVEDFRLHDYRHDLGTKMLRATGNLKAVQKALNHRSIKTTTKYAHVLDDDLRDAHDRVEEAKQKLRERLASDSGPEKESA